MTYCTRLSLVVLGASGFAVLSAVPVSAGERHLPPGAAQWQALDNCAAYGPGFTSAEGTNTCVRIGGHVRVEFGQGFYPDATRARAVTAAIRNEGAASGSDGPEPQHLRVDPAVGSGSFR